ncbi:hypothetical protein RDABS01_037915 [Bienertia sinuspersici]
MADMNQVMESGERPSELNVDRLSTLPWDVLNRIYGKLTIVDAVRTSVLAQDWRYRWLAQSGFTFDSQEIARRLNKDELSWDIVASAVNKFLRHNTSSIKSFSLKTHCSEHYPDMYQWIQYLSEQDVELLAICELCNSYFKMPSYLFSFVKLKSLSLTTCAVRIPTTFEKFYWLAELVLKDVSICDADLARLICSSPLLQNLWLWNIHGLKCLIIHGPRLTKLVIDSGFEDLFIGAAPGLVAVTIVAALRDPEDRVFINWHAVIRCLSGLVSLQTLVLSGDLIKIESAKAPKLSAKFIRGNWGRFCFPKLETITVTCPADISMGCAVNFIDFVISQSPNLMFLTIKKAGILDRISAPLSTSSNGSGRFVHML